MKKTIADSIRSKINKGEIEMKSRFSVWVEKLGINGGVFAILGLLIFTIGFILYWINSNNDLLFGGYGRVGFFSFIQSFPYVFAAVFIFLFFLLTRIFRTFDFSYKKPFFPILLAVLIGVILFGWLSVKQPRGQQFYNQEGLMFRMGMMNNANAVSGIVTEVSQNSITIKDESNKETIISLDSSTHFPFGRPKVGNQIRSVGSWAGDDFTAIGVRIFDETNPSTLGPGMMQGQGQKRGKLRNR